MRGEGREDTEKKEKKDQLKIWLLIISLFINVSLDRLYLD